MTVVEVLPVGQRTLAEIAADVNESHGRVTEGLSLALRHAIETGQFLLEAKAQLRHGEWMDWLSANIDARRETVTVYMRLAEFQHLLPEEFVNPTLERGKNGQTVSTASVTKAVAYLRAVGAKRDPAENRDAEYAEIRRLRDAGMGSKDIQQILGVSHSTVWRASLPDAERKRRDKVAWRKSQQKTRMAKRQEQAQAIAATKDELSDAYSLIVRCLQRVQQAHDKMPNGLSRRSLKAAMTSLHKAEDSIVQASKERFDKEAL